MESTMEEESGGLFENAQKAISMRTALSEMGHSQPPTHMTTDNTEANIIVNGTAKQKTSRSIDMRFYWVRHIIRQNNFHILWEEGKKTLSDYIKKHHPIWHHITTIPRYLKRTTKDTEKSKYRITETIRGCVGTTNTKVTRKPDNPLKGIHNPIPRKPDYPIKGIRNLVPNRIHSQWPRGVTVST